MDYTATFRENNYQVSIEVELKDNWCRKDIICNANVSDPNGFNLAGELAGSDQIDLRGFYKIEAKELQIENVQKGIIDKGQGFWSTVFRKY